MNKQEFLAAVEKIAKTEIVRVSKKGEHDALTLGTTCIGATERKNEKIWRKYGTLNNIVIFKTADEVNAILESIGVTCFKAYPTKSKTMCRLRNVLEL